MIDAFKKFLSSKSSQCQRPSPCKIHTPRKFLMGSFGFVSFKGTSISQRKIVFTLTFKCQKNSFRMKIQILIIIPLWNSNFYKNPTTTQDPFLGSSHIQIKNISPTLPLSLSKETSQIPLNRLNFRVEKGLKSFCLS